MRIIATVSNAFSQTGSWGRAELSFLAQCRESDVPATTSPSSTANSARSTHAIPSCATGAIACDFLLFVRGKMPPSRPSSSARISISGRGALSPFLVACVLIFACVGACAAWSGAPGDYVFSVPRPRAPARFACTFPRRTPRARRRFRCCWHSTD